MRGYHIILHTPTYHNEQFIGNIPDHLTVHAHSAVEARDMADLNPGTEHQVSDDLILKKEPQTIYSVTYLGKVVTRVVTEYEK